MNKIRIGLTVCFAALASASVIAGCSFTPAVTKDTLCSDFVRLTDQQRNDAVTRLAVELHNPDVTTPLGRPNVEYVCAQAPSMTVGQVIDSSRIMPAASSGPAETPSETPTPGPSESPAPSRGPDEQWSVVTELPDISGMLNGVILAVANTSTQNSLSLSTDWGASSITVEEDIPSEEFATGDAVLVADGPEASNVTVMAPYAWKSEAEGVKKPACHSMIRQYSFPLNKMWETEISTNEIEPNVSCDASKLTVTSDGRGVVVQPENAWISVASHKVHHASRGDLTVAGPMIGDFVTEMSGAMAVTMTVFDPVNETSFRVADRVRRYQDSPTAGEMYRQLAAFHNRPASWLDDDTVILGMFHLVRQPAEPISQLDVRTGKWKILFRAAASDNNRSGLATAVDPQTRTIVVAQNTPYSTDSVVAYSLTGNKLWAVKGADVCAVGGGNAVVQVNQQMATLDILSGKQINYNADADCAGTVVPPYLIRDRNGHSELFRILP